MEMASCLLHENSLPKFLWAEAINTVVYLLNRLPTRAVKGKTPFEAWHGFRPSVKHLRVFGSLVYSHVPAEKRGKLDEKAQLGILVGYGIESKGYRVLCLDKMQILVSRDVFISESSQWDWDSKRILKHDQSNSSLSDIPSSSYNSNKEFDVHGTTDDDV